MFCEKRFGRAARWIFVGSMVITAPTASVLASSDSSQQEEDRQRKKRFNPSRELDDFLNLTFEASKDFHKRIGEFEDLEGQKLTVARIDELKSKWNILADEIRASLAEVEADRAGEFFSRWEIKARNHPVFSRAKPYFEFKDLEPLLVLVSKKGRVSKGRANKALADVEPIFEDARNHFREWIAEPIGPDADFDANLFSIWLLADDRLFADALRATGVHDDLPRRAWFSVADQCAIASMSRVGGVQDPTLDELLSVFHVMFLDALKPGGLASAKSYWLIEGVTQALAGLQEPSLQKAAARRFLKDRESFGVPAEILLGPDGVPHPLGVNEISHLPSADELRWRIDAAHMIMAALLVGDDGGFHDVVTTALSAELDGKPSKTEMYRSLRIRKDKNLLDMGEAAAKSIVSGKKIKVRRR